MVVLNYTGEEINAKIVYYGPGVSGKTTNLEYIHEKMPVQSKGKLVSMKTRTDRTLFFDFLPVELGDINGYRTRFLLYTVPGQVYYNATRKLVLKGVDAVVFVVDSSRKKFDENIESLRNLEDNLNELGLSLDHVPWVIQYNKRDLPDAMPIAELHEQLNLLGVPAFEAIATEGTGVYETFQGVAELLHDLLKRRLDKEDVAQPVAVATPAAATPEPADESDDLSFAVDSALREVERPAATQNRAQSVGSPAHADVAGQPPASARETPAPVVPKAEPAVAVERAERTERTEPAEPAERTEKARARDFEFESLPADERGWGSSVRLDEASAASDVARTQEPDEFIIDPMRGVADNAIEMEETAELRKVVVAEETDDEPQPDGVRTVVLQSEDAPSEGLQPEDEVEPCDLTVPISIPASRLDEDRPLRVVLEIEVVPD
jgi:signal recognition particle receptor subunit beta